MAGTYEWNEYRKHEELRSQLKEIVRDDNALVQMFLDLDELLQMTFAEYFKRTEKNKDERDDLIQK